MKAELPVVECADYSQRRHSLAADHLLLVVLPRQRHKGRLDDPTAKTEHEVKGRLCTSKGVHRNGYSPCYPTKS
jgi:hypothetical protein